MQMSFFDGKIDFKINKPIRLIEFFAGYGSQSKALEELKNWGVRFQHWKICEWAIKSIQAYKDLHFKNDNTDYSKEYPQEFIINRLARWGISSNYNEPLTKEQIKRLGEKEQRKIYNNILATHNLVNIQQVRGIDLKIEDTDKYDYFLTYSFPCQDLSKAGLQKGMGKDSGTRSGMLWEVERILDELNEMGQNQLPKVLLMENVPDVIGSGAIKDFSKWLAKLEQLGYKCYWKILNAKYFGIPQNRERCFMISIRGDYFYSFPEEIDLKYKLIEILENQVDEKFYLSQKALNGKLNTNFKVSTLECVLPQEDGCCRTLCARDYKDPKCVIEPIACEIRTDEGIRTFEDNVMGTLRTIDCCGQKHIIEPTMKEQLCDRLIESGLLKVGDVINHSYTNGLTLKDYVESTNGICNTLTTMAKTQIQDNKTNIDKGNMTAITQNLRIRKLTPKECFRLMGIKDKDYEKIAENQSNASLYHLAGDSIVVPVLVAIFGQMIDGFNFEYYMRNFYKEIDDDKQNKSK